MDEALRGRKMEVDDMAEPRASGGEPGALAGEQGAAADLGPAILDLIRSEPLRFADLRAALLGGDPRRSEDACLRSALGRLIADGDVMIPRRGVYIAAGAPEPDAADVLGVARPDFARRRESVRAMTGPITQGKVAVALGVTRERVRQILKDMVAIGDLKISRPRGGVAVRYLRPAEAHDADARRRTALLRGLLLATQPSWGWCEAPDPSTCAVGFRAADLIDASVAEVSGVLSALRSEELIDVARLGYRERARLTAKGRRALRAMEGAGSLCVFDERLRPVRRSPLTLDQMLRDVEAAALMTLWMVGTCASPFVRAVMAKAMPEKDASGVAQGMARLAARDLIKRASGEQADAFRASIGWRTRRGPVSGGFPYVLASAGRALFPEPPEGCEVSRICALVETFPKGMIDGYEAILEMACDFSVGRPAPVGRDRAISTGQNALLEAMKARGSITTPEASAIFGSAGLNISSPQSQ